MFCFNLGEAADDEFFIQDLHLNFHSFLGFQHGSGSSVKAIMLLSAALPLAIDLNFCLFVIASLLYRKSASHTSIIYCLILKIFVYQTNFQKHSISTYLTWCQRRNWVTSMIDLTLIFNPSYVCHPTIWIFSGQDLFQNFLCVSEQNSVNLGITYGKHYEAMKTFDH